MALRDIFKVSRKTFINPSGWLDYDALKYQTRTIRDVLKNLFSTPTPDRQETFEQAMTRLKLTEEDVRYGAVNYRRFAWAFLMLGLFSFFYAFYLLFRYHTLLGLLLGVATAALFLAQAFKYDFWSLQMRRRKLGVTIDEWQQSILGNKDKTS